MRIAYSMWQPCKLMTGGIGPSQRTYESNSTKDTCKIQKRDVEMWESWPLSKELQGIRSITITFGGTICWVMEKLKKENLHIQHKNMPFGYLSNKRPYFKNFKDNSSSSGRRKIKFGSSDSSHRDASNVDLSNWTKIDWDRILKTYDYAQLFNKSKRKLNKDKIDEKVKNLLHNGMENKFSTLESEDARLTIRIIEFFHLCLRNP
ncbi:unnamed protein product [Rhizophagus irregularis]|nr:unnamed protein product [Rhizophagus irregularis]